MAQCAKTPAAKPVDLSLTPVPHKMEEENEFLYIVLWPSFVCYSTHTCTQINTNVIKHKNWDVKLA